ncbi:TPA: hypothetical protein ACHWZD_000084 [Streptococcus agalactiae]|nr:hypothetical protein [Streptococcus agalactiae]MCW1380953.1 hypothetical protein [Streptococcus agalactiae]MCW1391450.1 hypothetical protein [Streptococcus agalactiae]MDB8667441.1 hypothetical protein [Streptococcus agalactiae]MDK7257698.1 hypothetical protein [Streptococcus agalactiae]MDU7275439.1 hypothetical protein [Streptococcus agalactiae]
MHINLLSTISVLSEKLLVVIQKIIADEVMVIDEYYSLLDTV